MNDDNVLIYGIYILLIQAYNTRYAEEKRLYNERVEQFMRDLGGEKEQEAYRNSLAEYRGKRRAYLKQFRLKKLGLIKV